MKKRIFMMMNGAPGTGKGRFLERFKDYVIEYDQIRLMLTAPAMMPSGDSDGLVLGIPQHQNSKMIDLIMRILAIRMREGHLTIVDATHTNARSINAYYDLVTDNGYTAYLVRFGVDLATCQERNRTRLPSYKVVPKSVVTKMWESNQSMVVPEWVNVITPEEAASLILSDSGFYPRDR